MTLHHYDELLIKTDFITTKQAGSNIATTIMDVNGEMKSKIRKKNPIEIYAHFFIQKALSGAAILLSIYYFTHHMSPDEYGKYIIYLSTITALSNLFFLWLANVTQRFISQDVVKVDRYVYKNILKSAFLLAAVFVPIALLFESDKKIIAATIVFSSISAGVAAIMLQRANSIEDHAKYANAHIAKNFLLLASGVVSWHLLRSLDFLVLSVGFSYLLTTLFLLKFSTATGTLPAIDTSIKKSLKKHISGDFKIKDDSHLWRYGKYFILISLSTSVIDLSDKFLLAFLLGAHNVGAYAAPQTIIQYSFGAIVSVFFIYISPRVIRLFNEGKNEESSRVYKLMSEFIIYLGLFLFALIYQFVFVIQSLIGVGGGQVDDNTYTLVIAAIFAGVIKGYVIDFRLLINQNSRGVLVTTICTAVFNLLFSSILIPILGINGAPLGAIFAFLSGMIISIKLSYNSTLAPRMNILAVGAPIAGIIIVCIIGKIDPNDIGVVFLLKVAAAIYVIWRLIKILKTINEKV
jgi:O-antigen/teichoic acid export membrane protein